MYVCKDLAAPAHARTRAHRPAAPRHQSSGASRNIIISYTSADRSLNIPPRPRRHSYRTNPQDAHTHHTAGVRDRKGTRRPLLSK